MAMQRMRDRLAAMEAARWERLTPLERAYERIERGDSFEELSDTELEAVCADPAYQWMAAATDAELQVLATAPESAEARAIIARLGGAH